MTSPQTTVRIQGGPDRAKQGAWNKWVNNKTGNTSWSKHYYDAGSRTWFIIARSAADAQVFCQKLGGQQFDGSTLRCEVSGGSGGGGGSVGFGTGGFYTSHHNANARVKHISLTGDEERTIMDLLGRRWDAGTKMLNLNAFVNNQSSDAKHTFANVNFCEAVLNVIGMHCTAVVTMDLSNNGITSLEGFRRLHTVAPCLQNISLANNPLSFISELGNLKECNLREVLLTNEKLQHECGGVQRIFYGEVLRFLPSLQMLDSNPVPPSILNLGSSHQMLPRHAVLAKMPEVAPTAESCDPNARNFIMEYLRYFDGGREQRRQCGNAYHDKAYFSLTCSSNRDLFGQSRGSSRPYKLNRNLLNSESGFSNQRIRLIKIGKDDIVEALGRLPTSKHEEQHLAMDSNVFTTKGQQCMQVTLCGLFLDSQNTARKFSRCFLLIPAQSGGMCIMNEQFHIGSQMKNFSHVVIPGSEADKSCGVSGPAGVVAPSQEGLSEQQRTLVVKVAQHCKVTEHIAQQALAANNFDGNAAVQAIANAARGG